VPVAATNRRDGGQVAVGMNARLFPGNWRPLAQEAAFAAGVGFDCLQLVAYDEGIDAVRLGAPLDEAGATLREAGLGMVLEIVVRVDRDGRTAGGVTPFGALEACLPAIRALAVDRVHLHLAPTALLSAAEVAAVEDGALEDLAAGVELAEAVGFRLGLEHNEPRLGLFSDLARVRGALEAVPRLGFVWDVNHAPPDALDELLELTPRLSLLHVSDCPLPELNAHYPLGEGSLPLAGYLRALLERGWAGPAVLEIGGHPRFGGFGRDTDAALEASHRQLRAALAAARVPAA
jgi:sugar phosphate isomerase/epimerase